MMAMVAVLTVLSLLCLCWGVIGSLVFAFIKTGADVAGGVNIALASWFIAGGVLWIAATYTAVVAA